jgi:hypothetical protein
MLLVVYITNVQQHVNLFIYIYIFNIGKCYKNNAQNHKI